MRRRVLVGAVAAVMLAALIPSTALAKPTPITGASGFADARSYVSEGTLQCGFTITVGYDAPRRATEVWVAWTRSDSTTNYWNAPVDPSGSATLQPTAGWFYGQSMTYTVKAYLLDARKKMVGAAASIGTFTIDARAPLSTDGCTTAIAYP